MGCDSQLYLPPTTGLRDFTDVLAILLGAEVEEEVLCMGSSYASVDHDLEWRSMAGIPTMCGLNIGGWWHWEGESDTILGARLFSCSTQEHRKPVLIALADFFGGILDFNDCDAIETDHIGTLRDKAYRLDANDGAGWDALQAAILAVRPILSSTRDW